MAYSAAAADQTLPKPGKESVHDVIVRRFGGTPELCGLAADIWERAQKAQRKYRLEKPGLFTFNGRNALLEQYQEIVDAIVYDVQLELECLASGEAYPLDPAWPRLLRRAALDMRRALIAKGVKLNDGE